MFAPFFALALSLAPLDGPFAELGYEAALARAKEQSKLLLVDFTASWCPPCKRMEAETWPHADVRAWLAANAIAIQVDVDEQSELAQRFAVQAMPTIVAVKDGAEFDRIVGFRDAAGLLAWCKDVAAGRRASDALEERAKALAESDDVRARYDLARDLARAKQYERALAHYLWLWPKTREVPAMAGVRVSFMLRDMAELARKHAPARTAFLGLLADHEVKVEAAELPSFGAWQEWRALCDNFGEGARVIAWYEKRRDPEGRLFAAHSSTSRESAVALERITADVFDALMRADRSQDAVRLYGDARRRAASLVQDYERFMGHLAAGGLEEGRDELEAQQRRKLTDELCELYGALLASERAPEAADVGALLVRTLDTAESRLALVRAAIGVSRAPADLDAWLAEAETAGGQVEGLRRRLERLKRAPAETPGEERGEK
jgi:thiol-disulfide isomerase/thioredoxin